MLRYYRVVLALNGYKYVPVNGKVFLGIDRSGVWIVCIGYKLNVNIVQLCVNKSEALFTAEVLLKGVD